MTRTVQQNRALHKYLALVAATLNAENLGVTVVLKPDTEWSMEGVKEMMWKPIQQAVLGKSSTTKLTRTELTEVYDIMNKALAERFDIHIPFPS
jgi:nicotinamide riboside kinase